VISVVIPALNAAHTIEDQLAALARQRFDGAFEVIVADNGSTDDTPQIVESWAGKLPGLRFVDASGRLGSASARNAGVRAARGTAIAFCDADDAVTEGWLAALVEGLEHGPLVAGRRDLQDPTGRVWLPAGPVRPFLDFLPFADSCSMAVDRAVLESVGGFAEELMRSSDVDLSWRIQLAGHDLVEAPDALAHKVLSERRSERLRQAYVWGRAQPMLYARHRTSGMPRPSIGSTLRDVALIVATTLTLWHPRARHRWGQLAPVHAGRIAGCRRARCWYP
jgi:glycosyltransferase involved in cell wall biosynthesis